MYKKKDVVGKKGSYVKKGHRGSGSFGDVFKGIEKGSEKKVALKYLRKSKFKTDELAEKYIKKEVEALQKLTEANSANIVELYDVIQVTEKRKETFFVFPKYNPKNKIKERRRSGIGDGTM